MSRFLSSASSASNNNNINNAGGPIMAAAAAPQLLTLKQAMHAPTGAVVGEEGCRTLTRTVLVHISGNRATWEHLGVHGAVWQMNPERSSLVFGDALCGLNTTTTTATMMAAGMTATTATTTTTATTAPTAATATTATTATTASNANAATSADNHLLLQQLMIGGSSSLEQTLVSDRLSRAMLQRVVLLESHTNIDEVVAVQVDGLPSREFTKNGEGAAVFLTGEGRVTHPQELFSVSCNSELGMQWMRQFPRYSSDNLETEGVMFLTGASYYFVHQEHPVVFFLRSNEEHLGIMCFQEPSLEGGWIRIDVETFVFIVHNLRDTLLRNTPSTFNLNQLTVRVTKPDAQRWLQLTPQLVNTLIPDEVRETNDVELISEARRLGVQRYFDRPLFVTLRLSIEYALPEAATKNNNSSNSNPMLAMMSMMRK